MRRCAVTAAHLTDLLGPGMNPCRPSHLAPMARIAWQVTFSATLRWRASIASWDGRRRTGIRSSRWRTDARRRNGAGHGCRGARVPSRRPTSRCGIAGRLRHESARRTLRTHPALEMGAAPQCSQRAAARAGEVWCYSRYVKDVSAGPNERVHVTARRRPAGVPRERRGRRSSPRLRVLFAADAKAQNPDSDRRLRVHFVPTRRRAAGRQGNRASSPAGVRWCSRASVTSDSADPLRRCEFSDADLAGSTAARTLVPIARVSSPSSKAMAWHAAARRSGGATVFRHAGDRLPGGAADRIGTQIDGVELAGQDGCSM